MQAATSRRTEYATAASILLLAMVLASWIIISRTALKLPAPVTPPRLRIESEDAAKSPANAAPSPAGAIELVELPADLFPAPKAASAPPSAAQPSAVAPPPPEAPETKPQPAAPAPPSPVEKPAAQATAPVEETAPKPLPAPREIAKAQALPPPEPPQKPLEPLRPEPPQPQAQPKTLVPLQPESIKTAEAVSVAPKPLVPLRPEPQPQVQARQPERIVPLRPEPPRPEPMRLEPQVAAAQPQLLVPLTPEPPVAKPVTKPAAAPAKPIEQAPPSPHLERDDAELAFADVVAPEEAKPQPRPVAPPAPKEPPLKEFKEARLEQAQADQPPVKQAPVNLTVVNQTRVNAAPAAAAPTAKASAPPKAPPAQSEPRAAAIDAGAAAGEGRALLRIFEQGSGPSIEIKWPSDSDQRDRLYSVFVRCLGMRVGVLDSEGHLFLPEGEKGRPFELNTDVFSTFVRRPEGAMATDEQREVARVRSYHGMPSFGSPARLFPRHVDAYLIGGLRQAVGDDYLKTHSIHAAYRLSGGHVLVNSIAADGHPIAATIDLSAVGSSCGE